MTPSGGARCVATQHRNRTSQPDSLHFTQCNLVLCPIVKFGCSRRRGLSSNWTGNRVKPGRGSHFFLPYRIFSPSTTFSPSLRSVPSGASTHRPTTASSTLFRSTGSSYNELCHTGLICSDSAGRSCRAGCRPPASCAPCRSVITRLDWRRASPNSGASTKPCLRCASSTTKTCAGARLHSSIGVKVGKCCARGFQR